MVGIHSVLVLYRVEGSRIKVKTNQKMLLQLVITNWPRTKMGQKNCQKVAKITKMAKNSNRSMAPCSEARQSQAKRSHYFYLFDRT